MAQIFFMFLLALTTWIAPVSVDVTGNSAGGSGGALPGGLRYWLGTNDTPGTADMRFDAKCRSLALDMTQYGPLATTARVTLYQGRHWIDTQAVNIAPVTLRARSWFDRVVLTNVTPDPAAIDDSATLTLMDARCGVR